MESYMVDVGANFARMPLDEAIKHLQYSYLQGIAAIVTITNDLEIDAKHNIALAEKAKALFDSGVKITKVFFVVGSHPNSDHLALRTHQFDLIRKATAHPLCVGVGEIGLDYNRMRNTKGNQLTSFDEQVRIAKECNKQLFLHCREHTDNGSDSSACDDMIAVLKKHNYFKGIVHCFTNGLHQATRFTELGFTLGITGWLLDKRRNSNLVEAISSSKIPVTSLLVETDSPYMAIKGLSKRIHNGRPISSPEDVYHIIQEIASLKELKFEDVHKTIYETSLKFLNQTSL